MKSPRVQAFWPRMDKGPGAQPLESFRLPSSGYDLPPRNRPCYVCGDVADSVSAYPSSFAGDLSDLREYPAASPMAKITIAMTPDAKFVPPATLAHLIACTVDCVREGNPA